MADINMSRVSGTPLRTMSVSTGSPIGMSADDPAGGARIVEDTELNDTSQHPVQNKAITEFVTQSRALFARNIGDLEAEALQYQEEMAAVQAAMAGMNVSWLNTPNLLNPDAWWLNNGSGNIVCGDAARHSKSGGAYMKSIKAYDYYTTEPTAEQTAGATYVYHLEAGTYSDGTSYPEAWIVYRDTDDGITTSCVDLTGDAIINDTDGATYNKAIQYNITENTAWGNMETLYYPQGYSTQYYKQGDTPKSYGYYVDEMEVGKTYTVSCWARLTSGTEAWIKFGWGQNYYNGLYKTDISDASDTVKITSTEWTRVWWTFKFEPQGAWYTETTESATDTDGTTYTKVIRQYNWQKRVMIGVHRKYTAVLQLTGFRLTEGGIYGNHTVDTMQLKIEELEARIADLESRVNNA